MKIVKCIGIFIVVLWVAAGLFATCKGIREVTQELKAEAVVEVQKQEVERQAALDLVKARTEWYRTQTGEPK